MEEIDGCHSVLNMTFKEIDNLPIQQRKYHIIKHNMRVDQQNEEMKSTSHSSSGMDINSVAQMAQGVKR